MCSPAKHTHVINKRIYTLAHDWLCQLCQEHDAHLNLGQRRRPLLALPIGRRQESGLLRRRGERTILFVSHDRWRWREPEKAGGREIVRAFGEEAECLEGLYK
jgi:hypothetical protein